MLPEAIEVGKTYVMLPGIKNRKVVDIIWHPVGEKDIHEHREVIIEMTEGKRVGFRERVSLKWMARKSVREI